MRLWFQAHIRGDKMAVEIYFEDNSELAEFEALNKGYRKDVIVQINNKKYRVYITSILRLQQDFETEQAYSGYYLSEPNTILVNETSADEIRKTILKLYQCKYFDRLDNNGFDLSFV